MVSSLAELAMQALTPCWHRHAHARLLPAHLANDLVCRASAFVAATEHSRAAQLVAVLAAERFRITRLTISHAVVNEHMLSVLQPIAGQLREIVLDRCVISLLTKRSRGPARCSPRVYELCRAFKSLQVLRIVPQAADMRCIDELEQHLSHVFTGCDVCVDA